MRYEIKISKVAKLLYYNNCRNTTLTKTHQLVVFNFQLAAVLDQCHIQNSRRGFVTKCMYQGADANVLCERRTCLVAEGAPHRLKCASQVLNNRLLGTKRRAIGYVPCERQWIIAAAAKSWLSTPRVTRVYVCATPKHEARMQLLSCGCAFECVASLESLLPVRTIPFCTLRCFVLSLRQKPFLWCQLPTYIRTALLYISAAWG